MAYGQLLGLPAAPLALPACWARSTRCRFTVRATRRNVNSSVIPIMREAWREVKEGASFDFNQRLTEVEVLKDWGYGSLPIFVVEVKRNGGLRVKVDEGEICRRCGLPWSSKVEKIVKARLIAEAIEQGLLRPPPASKLVVFINEGQIVHTTGGTWQQPLLCGLLFGYLLGSLAMQAKLRRFREQSKQMQEEQGSKQMQEEQGSKQMQEEKGSKQKQEDGNKQKQEEEASKQKQEEVEVSIEERLSKIRAMAEGAERRIQDGQAKQFSAPQVNEAAKRASFLLKQRIVDKQSTFKHGIMRFVREQISSGNLKVGVDGHQADTVIKVNDAEERSSRRKRVYPRLITTYEEACEYLYGKKVSNLEETTIKGIKPSLTTNGSAVLSTREEDLDNVATNTTEAKLSTLDVANNPENMNGAASKPNHADNGAAMKVEDAEISLPQPKISPRAVSAQQMGVDRGKLKRTMRDASPIEPSAAESRLKNNGSIPKGGMKGSLFQDTKHKVTLNQKSGKHPFDGLTSEEEQILFKGLDEQGDSEALLFKHLIKTRIAAIEKKSSTERSRSLGIQTEKVVWSQNVERWCATETHPDVQNFVKELGQYLDRRFSEDRRRITKEQDVRRQHDREVKIQKKLDLMIARFGASGLVQKYQEYRPPKPDLLWWFDWQYVACVRVRTLDSEGLLTLNMAEDTVNHNLPHIISFQDAQEAMLSGTILARGMGACEGLVAIYEPKELFRFATEQKLKVTVIKKGQLKLYADKPSEELNYDIYKIGRDVYVKEELRQRSIDWKIVLEDLEHGL